MKKQIIVWIGILAQLIGIQAFAQTKKAKNSIKKLVVSTVPMATTGKSLLWKISGNGLRKPSYIFGTMHAICNEDYFFNATMKNALEQCAQLVLEINIDDPKTTQQLAEKSLLGDDKQLKNYFSNEEEYKQFSDQVKTNTEINVEDFARFKPFVLLSVLSMKELACATPSSYEINLIDIAKKRKMTIEGLETVESQLAIFDKMDDSELKQFLLSTLNEMEEDRVKENELITNYKNQDIEALYNMIMQSKEMLGHTEQMLNDRNKKWVHTLPLLLSKNTTFIAVGAGHLFGNEGVLNLLRQAHYTVEPVENK